MNNYKVQFTKTYVIDVMAENEERARMIAEPILDEKMRNGTDHYYEQEMPDVVFFDVTDTEDPFNPEN